MNKEQLRDFLNRQLASGNIVKFINEHKDPNDRTGPHYQYGVFARRGNEYCGRDEMWTTDIADVFPFDTEQDALRFADKHDCNLGALFFPIAR